MTTTPPKEPDRDLSQGARLAVAVVTGILVFLIVLIILG